jgi:nitrate reductase gamma subunit
VLVPVLGADHIALWERFLGIGLPRIGAASSDLLTLVAIAGGTILLGNRIIVARVRNLSRFKDFLVVIMVLLPMITGYLAAHPATVPVPWNVLALIHILSGEALFVAVPFTKLAHVVLFPFERLSQAYWHLEPGAGGEVARRLRGEEATV